VKTRSLRITVICFGLVAPAVGLADRGAYTTVADVSVQGDRLEFSQHLDPKLRELPASDGEAVENPFLLEHRPIFVELRERDSGTVIFRKFAPNLTHLWIDPGMTGMAR
jgi:hypothetical protein